MTQSLARLREPRPWLYLVAMLIPIVIPFVLYEAARGGRAARTALWMLLVIAVVLSAVGLAVFYLA